MSKNYDITEHQRLNLETAKVPWKELQKFFAQGLAINVDKNLDLIDIGVQISKDNKEIISTLMEQGKIKKVDDHQAQKWLNEEVMVWALVIKPWLLIQEC